MEIADTHCVTIVIEQILKDCSENADLEEKPWKSFVRFLAQSY